MPGDRRDRVGAPPTHGEAIKAHIAAMMAPHCTLLNIFPKERSR